MKKSIVEGTGVATEQNSLWDMFAERENLTAQQLAAFKTYYQMLIDWNARVNLTRITSLEDALAYHFSDSLQLGHGIDMQTITSIADIGSGAGFPGIPLKIKYPHLQVTLIEVSGKRREFLQHVIQALGLQDSDVSYLDWRTFIRKTEQKIDLFCARASLQIPELLRVFKPSSHYQSSQLVYWASDSWMCPKNASAFLKREHPYAVGQKTRKLVFFRAPSAQ